MSSIALDRVQHFDPRALTAEFYHDPYPTLHALRHHAPVFRCPDGAYFLTRHADLMRVYRDPKGFSSDKQRQFAPVFGASPLFEHHTTSLVFNDPPLHTQVRQAVGDALSPKAVLAMEDSVQTLVNHLLDALETRVQFDCLDDFASVIPVEVIGNLLRVPRDERGPLRGWSNAILGALEFGLDGEGLNAGNRAVIEFVDYLKTLIAERRQHLSSDPDDILSRLISWERRGERLSAHQLYHQCIFLLNAGHETTTNLIANGLHTLLDHPSEMARLTRDPKLMGNAVEEFLRFESPVQLGNRTVTSDTTLSDTALPAGTTLTLSIGAANRDPAVFVHPDALDITREASAHVAFGSGIHTCAGLHVAKLEARIALAGLLKRFPKVRRTGPAVRAKRARFRGFESFPLAIE